MKLLPEVSDEAAEKLLRLMTEADGGQPFMTHSAAAKLGAFIIAELGKIVQQAEGAPSVKPEWGTVGQIATIYGMKSARADDYLLAWVAEGKVRVITPADPLTGKKGHKRYNLADVAACMEAKS